jgi:ferric-dicitrate binding protein FerR (iron transport regulator)
MNEPNYRSRILLQRYLSNTCTREELGELMALLNKTPIDEELRSAMEEHWRKIQDLSGIPDADAKLDRMFEGTRPGITHSDDSASPLRQRPRWQRYAAAAALIGGIAIAGYLYFNRSAPQPGVLTENKKRGAIKDVAPGSNKATLILENGDALILDSNSNQVVQQGNSAIHLRNGSLQYTPQGSGATPSFNILSTPRGGQYQVALPDGSKVWLNASSRLRYPTAFTGRERVVELSGQAYFEVEKKEGQPFRVQVQGAGGDALEVLALGTSFDIMAYADEHSVNTTLTEGAVKVSLPAESRVLRPGQQAAVPHSNRRIQVQQVNTEQVLAWKNGYFSFHDADVPTIMRQLSRWYDVDISYPDGTPQGLFSGEIGKSLSLSQALSILEQARVPFRMEGDRHIVVLRE